MRFIVSPTLDMLAPNFHVTNRGQVITSVRHKEKTNEELLFPLRGAVQKKMVKLETLGKLAVDPSLLSYVVT